MSSQALAIALQLLPEVNGRLRLASNEALEVVADDFPLVHLEQRNLGHVPQALTPPLAPGQLLTLIDGMGLALDLDRRLVPSRSIFRPLPAPPPPGPASAATGRLPELR